MEAGVVVGLVRLDRVRFHPHNVRRELGDLRQLAESIASIGLMQPIVVEEHGDHFRLRAGHRRVAAARLAKLSRIPAVIHSEVLDDEAWLIHSIQENVMRRGLDHEERRRAVLALRDLKCSWVGIAEAFGASVSAVRIWAGVDQPKPKSSEQRVKISASTLQMFVAAWRFPDRTITAEAVLNALSDLADTGRVTGCLPADRGYLRQVS